MPQADLETWGAIGPVRTMRHEYASWDAERSAWEPVQRSDDFVFTRAGLMAEYATRNHDGSISRRLRTYDKDGHLVEDRFEGAGAVTRTLYSYDPSGRPAAAFVIHPDGSRQQTEAVDFDETGRKVKVQFLRIGDVRVDAFGVEGSETVYGVPDAATLTTSYDPLERPVRAEFHDETHSLLNIVTFVRDLAGRVLTEESRFVGDYSPMARRIQERPDLTAEPRTEMLKMVAVVYEGGLLCKTDFEYDSNGRVATLIRRFGALSEHRSTFLYDSHGNVTDQIDSQRGHQVSKDEATGLVVHGEPSSHITRSRLEYTYDATGNWTEKVVSAWIEADGDFRRWSLERRVISYWPK